MTEGGRLVADLVARVGAAEFGRRVRTSEGMARHLATGRKTPGDALKERIADRFGVAPSAWDEPAKADPAPRKKREPLASKPLPAAKPKVDAPAPKLFASAVEELRSTIARVDEALELVESDVLAAPSQRAQLLRVKVDACDKLAKLQGEGELTMAMLVRSRLWREILGRLEPVFEKHPDAAADVAEVLEELEGP